MARIIPVEFKDELSLLRGSFVAMGVYDGVHRGHQQIIASMCECAREGAEKVIITFDKDPDELFDAAGLRKLMTNEQRIGMLSKLPVDAVLVLPFTRQFASLEPAEFLGKAFAGHMPAEMHIGWDFHFGKRGMGDVGFLSDWGGCRGMHVRGYDLFAHEGAPITATRIRNALSDGDVRLARELLGRPYEIAGAVEHGRGEGAALGFATANLSIPSALLCLREGVYGGMSTIDGVRYRCALSVGVSPTYRDSSTANLEAHIIGFSGNLYGRELRIDVLEHVRPMIRFGSREELVATVRDNIRWISEDMPI